MGKLAPPRETTGHHSQLRCLGAALFVLLILLSAPLRAEYAPHPRIYLTPERIERIRTSHFQADSYEWQRLMKTAERTDMDGVQAQALAYAATGDETWAAKAVENLRRAMRKNPELQVSFNSVGRSFHSFALAFDWLYSSPRFTDALKSEVIDYVNAVPEEGRGKWNWYPEQGYFNGAAKILWGPPVWGLATWGDNPRAQHYVDNGRDDRWAFVRNAFGYGPENLAVARGGCLPQGLDYGSGTMANLLRYVEAVRTATGEDLYEEAPAIREFLDFFVNAYYDGGGFIRRPEHGHNAHKRGGYLASSVTALLIVMDRYSATPEARRASWWLANVRGAAELPGSDHRFYSVYDVIFSNDSIPQQAPLGQPLSYFADGNGMWICRSDWAAAGPRTFATFRAGNWTWFNQNQWDQGNFCITHLGEDLVVDAGLYDGGGGQTVINYHNQTIAHNSITVKDPEQKLGWHFFEYSKAGYENSGGQSRPWRETLPGAILDGKPKDESWPAGQGSYLHDMADVLRREQNEGYTYAFADITNAYANERWKKEYEKKRLKAVKFRPKVESVTRQWLYLRAESEEEREFFVTFDRVRSSDPGFVKKNHLHFIGEPHVTNGESLHAEVPGHVETWSGNRFEMEQGRAVLHGAILLPASPQLRKVGGDGYEYWVNGRNHDPFPDSEEPLGGRWRLEIQPPEPKLDDLFLTVLSPGPRGSAAPDFSGISVEGAEGTEFGSWVLLFSPEESPLGELSYRIESMEMRRHLLCDLEPGRSYRVLRDGARFEEFRASEAGTGRFVSERGGEFRLLPGGMSPDS